MKALADHTGLELASTGSGLSHISEEDNDSWKEIIIRRNMISLKRQKDECTSESSDEGKDDQLCNNCCQHFSHTQQNSNLWNKGSIGCSFKELAPYTADNFEDVSRRRTRRILSRSSYLPYLIQRVAERCTFPSFNVRW